MLIRINNTWTLNTNVQSLMHSGRHERMADLSTFLDVCDVTSIWLAAVAHVTHISHIHVFSFLFLDDKSHFHVAFRSLAFCSSSEEHRWVDLAWIFWSDVIIFKAQTAPWVAFFNFFEKDFCPVATQQSATAWESIYRHPFPVFSAQLEPCCSSIDIHTKVFFLSSVFVLVGWIWINLQK